MFRIVPSLRAAYISIHLAVPHPSSKSPVSGDFESTFPPGEGLRLRRFLRYYNNLTLNSHPREDLL